MDTTQEYRATTLRTLLETMRKYMDDNRHSRDVNERWLTDYLVPVWKTICEVGNCRLTQENSSAAKAFRAAELQKQIDDKKQETERLEDELKKLSKQPSDQ